jgi:hypothetical protein
LLLILFVLSLGEIVEQLGELLESAGMADVLAIPRARMPVVKFRVPETGGDAGYWVNTT